MKAEISKNVKRRQENVQFDSSPGIEKKNKIEENRKYDGDQLTNLASFPTLNFFR